MHVACVSTQMLDDIRQRAWWAKKSHTYIWGKIRGYLAQWKINFLCILHKWHKSGIKTHVLWALFLSHLWHNFLFYFPMMVIWMRQWMNMKERRGGKKIEKMISFRCCWLCKQQQQQHNDFPTFFFISLILSPKTFI